MTMGISVCLSSRAVYVAITQPQKTNDKAERLFKSGTDDPYFKVWPSHVLVSEASLSIAVFGCLLPHLNVAVHNNNGVKVKLMDNKSWAFEPARFCSDIRVVPTDPPAGESAPI